MARTRFEWQIVGWVMFETGQHNYWGELFKARPGMVRECLGGGHEEAGAGQGGCGRLTGQLLKPWPRAGQGSAASWAFGKDWGSIGRWSWDGRGASRKCLGGWRGNGLALTKNNFGTTFGGSNKFQQCLL